jgi:hypothetical protein
MGRENLIEFNIRPITGQAVLIFEIVCAQRLQKDDIGRYPERGIDPNHGET